MAPSEMEESTSVLEENDPSKNLLETASIGSFGSLDSLICEDEDFEKEIQKKKKYKRGVVYISFIPPSMNPTILRRLLSDFGSIERIYLQPKLKKGKKLQKKNMKNVKFTEGWVEFLKKRDAKHIASILNNTPIGGKKKSKFREYLWNLKYLPRFKWIHLCERLNYERAVKQQRLRAEVSQAKKIANHFAETVDKEERQKRRKGPKPTSQSTEILEKRFKQKKTKEEKQQTEEKREDFLKNLFG